MTTISASLVKELRDITGAGILECRNALTEAAGDLEKAQSWLLERGLAKAAKKADRVTAEGLVGAVVDGLNAAVIEVNSETDFVARNDVFQGFVANCAKLALSSPSLEALGQQNYPSTTHSVSEELTRMIATIGENMSLRRCAQLSVASGIVVSYVHNNVVPGLGKIGVIAGFESSAPQDRLAGMAKQIAMHIAASSPAATTVAEVNKSAVLQDLELSAGDAGAEEAFKKYCTESVLMEQAFIMDPERTIAQVLADFSAEVDAPVVLKSYVRYKLGEGIEKEQTDFAAEVAAAAK